MTPEHIRLILAGIPYADASDITTELGGVPVGEWTRNMPDEFAGLRADLPPALELAGDVLMIADWVAFIRDKVRR